MAKVFELLSDLPVDTQMEVERIQAIDSGSRTTVESALMTSLAPYLTNEVILRNEDDEIVLAIGETLPTDYEGFAKPALFFKSNAADGTKGLYENVGTNTAASWNLIGEITTAEIGDGQVTAAKLAAALDLSSVAISKLKIEVGTPVNAVAATQTFTLSGVITPGAHAESVLTSDTTNVSNGETVTIGARIYRFQDTMTAIDDVQIGASYDLSLLTLQHAINGTGTPGTDYYTGTTAHADVRAYASGATMLLKANVPGTAANSIVTTETSAHLSWADTTLGGGTGDSNPGVAAETVTIDGITYSFLTALSESTGATSIANQVLFGADSAAALDNLKLAINAGAGAGTNYSTATTVHPTVNATTNTNTEQTVSANVKGTAAHSIAVTDAVANGAWGAGNLAGGVNGTLGLAKQILADSSYLYIAIAANTVADANWRRIAVGSAF